MFLKPHRATTENESREMQLDSYVTYVHSHHCASCGAVETFSECFEVWLHPTKTRTSNLRDLRPIVGGFKSLRMAKIAVPPRKIPLCYNCVEDYRAAGQPETTTITTEAWQETLRRKYAPPPKAEPKVARADASPSKTIPSLDEI